MMQIIIKLESDIEIEFFEIHDLSQNISKVGNNQAVELKYDWHMLVVPYRGKKIEITDIKINEQSLAHVIYTGFFEDDAGKKISTSNCRMD